MSIYLAGGIVINESISSSDAKENGTFVEAALFRSEEEAIKYANDLVSDTADDINAIVDEYASSVVEKVASGQYNDVWIKYSDGEVIKVCVWEFEEPKLPTTHECKYCGGVADGPDEDVLCEDCQMTFGHAFYSEL